MDDVQRVRVVGPLEVYAAGFAAELTRLGYTVFSARLQLQLAAHLSRWLAGEGMDASMLTSAVVAQFLVARRAAGYTAYRSPTSLSSLLGYLRGLGVSPLPVVPVPEGPVEVLLERYRRYLVGERGLGEPTARGYVGLARPFVVSRATADGVDLAGLSPAEVVGFVLAVSGERTPKTAQQMVSVLRSLLRFCHVQGLLSVPLAGAVPKVSNRRAGLPRFLEPAQVESLLASCDRGDVAGRRDFAMMTMMVRLGLRAGEVAGLGLGDIDWRRGEITVVGKGPRSERLPLPTDVGAAVANYLRHARPDDAIDRCVFVRVKAPHRGLTSGGVTQAVIAAGGRAGLGPLTAHRLRHTAATGMLRAGAPLAQVGQVLRHHRALTTATYAKVDRDTLRTLARPWPGGAA
ncbi:MAG TPA: tyrosine-type recombinase/integrase [Sporichthyaceae bacterium]